MNRLGAAFLLSALIFTPSVARANDGAAENHLVDGVIAYRNRDWKAAFRALKRARREVESRALAAKIERQAGLILIAVGRPVRALAAFRRAVALDRNLALDRDDFGRNVRSLFYCAHRMKPDAPSVTSLEPDGEGGWRCPAAAPSPPAAPRAATIDGTDERAVDLGAHRPPPEADRGSALGALGGVGIGLMVIGLGTGAGVFAWQQSEANEAAEEGRRVRGLIADLDGSADDTGGLVEAFNAAEADRVGHEDNATIAMAVGGGVAAFGLAMLIIDLVDGPKASERLASRPRLGLRVGPGTLAFSF